MNLGFQKKIFLTIYVLLAVLIIIIFGVMGASKFHEQDGNKTINEISKCSIETTIVAGENDPAKLYNRYNNEIYQWNYFEYDNINSSNISSYEKLLRVFQNLGYLSEDAENKISTSCTISKEKIDYMMSELFSDTNYESIDFYNDCSPFNFIYNEKNKEYKVKKHYSGCGDASYYISNLYDEKKDSEKLTFKVKVLSNNLGEYYRGDNSGNLVSLNIYENDIINDTNVLDKYGESANIYEWTFIKNSNDNYVLESVKKVK